MVALASLRTPQQLAEITGVSLPAVRGALARAGVEHNGAGRYDMDEAVAAIHANVDPDRLMGHMASGTGNMTPAALVNFGGMRQDRAALEEIKVARARLAYDRERKALVSADDVDEAARALIGKLRAAVMATPKRIAARVVAEGATTHTAVVGIADEECRAALAEAADIGAIVRELIG